MLFTLVAVAAAQQTQHGWVPHEDVVNFVWGWRDADGAALEVEASLSRERTRARWR